MKSKKKKSAYLLTKYFQIKREAVKIGHCVDSAGDLALSRIQKQLRRLDDSRTLNR